MHGIQLDSGESGAGQYGLQHPDYRATTNSQDQYVFINSGLAEPGGQAEQIPNTAMMPLIGIELAMEHTIGV